MSASQALEHLLGSLAGRNHAHLAFRTLGSRGRRWLRVIHVSHADIYAQRSKKFPGIWDLHSDSSQVFRLLRIGSVEKQHRKLLD
jgi:hypothetical protein